jgi:glycine/D-amino acid oxidase-like deaminating enzyme
MTTSQDRAAPGLENTKPAVFWSDREDAPPPAPPVEGRSTVDLAVVGGGFSGLWAAIEAIEEQPGLRVAVVEAERCGFGASSRNGGFCDSSLTHGLHNGLAHWPDETATLLRLGRENLDGLEATIGRHGIQADFHRSAMIDAATEPWHLRALGEDVHVHRSVGNDVELLDREQIQASIGSPTFLGGLRRSNGFALVDPARLAWGLRSAAESLGVTIHERSPVTAIDRDGGALVVHTADGSLRADRVVVATNAYRGPVRRPRRYVIPVYDHVLMTEPLSSEQMASIGWAQREGLEDVSNQFHYYRLTEDDRILYGGYDATYHFNNGLRPEHDQKPATHRLLAADFFRMFPQLEGLGFSHSWGGPVGTTTRFTATWGKSHDGRLVWVAGYTGLGVGASRFGARVALDLLFGRQTERTDLEMVRKKPFPFPPEPFRWTGVQLTRNAIQRADDNEGRRGLWLRFLDRFGIGFDS